MDTVREGDLLWEPPDELRSQSSMHRYVQWLWDRKGKAFTDYENLWEWSVSDLGAFWSSIWEFFDVRASAPYTTPLASRRMPGAEWFPGARLNYAEHALRHVPSERPALIFRSEIRPVTEMSWNELYGHVSSVASALRGMGVRRGDRVAAYLPNIPEAVIAFLATASIGAVWSSCSPDFGTPSVLDRFGQIEPKVLFAVDGYQYNGKPFDRREVVSEIQRSLPTLERTVLVPYLRPDRGIEGLPNALPWGDLLAERGGLEFEQVPFNHPLWVLYSSGTTGLPKAIVQGHGGILLEHLKAVGLHGDIKPGSRFFWFTTTGWMMWNYLLGGLLLGATVLLYDGSPGFPDTDVLWRFAEETEMSCLGTSAAYITSCMRAGLEPGKVHDLSHLRSIGSTGSPLSPEGFAWVYEHVKPDIWLASSSGGTDVCTAFLAGCPLLPVRAGELQCRTLGTMARAFDEQGRPVVDEVGELVLTEPLPSTPLRFWNDPGNRRYIESYFDVYPGVWRHGDWVKFTRRGSAVIYGRSDSTINRMGVRMGSSEIYRVVEGVPEVADSLMVGIERPGGGYYMPLFVALRDDGALTDELRERISSKIRESLSARYVPDAIFEVPEVPYTLSGKKMEVPIKRILMGVPPERAANAGAMKNPEALKFFIEMANARTQE